MNVMVGYASAHGSTEEIAERIVAQLVSHGLHAQAHPVGSIADLTGVDAFVLGSAVHNGSWLPQAVEFVERHRAELATCPTWLFSVGARDALYGPMGARLAARYPEPKEVASFQKAIQPRDHRVFSGVVRHEHYPLLGRWLFRLMGGHFGDFHDWRAIENWTDEIAARLVNR